MNIDTAVFVSDAITLQNTMLPLSGLVQSMEAPLAKAIEWGTAYGMPAHLGHDLCRPIGWSEPRGVYIASDMSRLIGRIYRPETDADQKNISTLRQNFLLLHQAEQVEPYADELQQRIAPFATKGMRWWHREAAAAIEPSLASAIYPEFFAIDSDHVDKDGLVDFAFLLERTREVHPGVFHDPAHDLLVFAHPFFRRSLSRNNSLNAYVLQSFAQAAASPGVTARLRLDPDLIGHPASAGEVMELEYWHGPRYDDDVAAIPSGVAEHKNSDGDRQMSGVDKTQIWWKAPEDRAEAGGSRAIRTFEVEELIDDDSPGLAEGMYGCRYAHAEYDLASRSLSHFDGAIRAYASDAYFERIERRIDRAGKHADYTKLFRLDGALSVPMWKRVLTDWYRGNRLIPEYLGAPQEDLAAARPPAPSASEPERPALAAFLCLEKASMPAPSKIMLGPDQSIVLEDRPTAVAEIGQGQAAAVMGQWASPETTTIAARDKDANLARILLPGDPPNPAGWRAVAGPLAAAMAADAAEGTSDRIAIAIGWTLDGIMITLSIAGDAAPAAALLDAAVAIVEPNAATSEWVEPFRDALVAHAPPLTAPVLWPSEAARRGRLTLAREGELEFRIKLGAKPSPSTT